MKDKMFQSKQTGTRESKEINIEGRVQFDVMQVLQRDYKLASYSLNSVCGTVTRFELVHCLPRPLLDVSCSDPRLGSPLPRRAEGGCAPLDHLRSPGGQR